MAPCDWGTVSETFLDGRVKVAQPQTGFRSGLDAVMLAAAVPATAGQTVLELGAGAGTASLCLVARVPGILVTGVEIDESLAALAARNAAANSADCKFAAADIFALPSDLKREFDQVLANPPFHGEGQASPDPMRAAALMDGGALRDWLRLGLQRTVSGGFSESLYSAMVAGVGDREFADREFGDTWRAFTMKRSGAEPT